MSPDDLKSQVELLQQAFAEWNQYAERELTSKPPRVPMIDEDLEVIILATVDASQDLQDADLESKRIALAIDSLAAEYDRWKREFLPQAAVHPRYYSGSPQLRNALTVLFAVVAQPYRYHV